MMKGVLFAASSAYLSFLERFCKTFLTLCPTMAMFPTATLFFVLVVAFVKHADGVRGPTQEESMIETEVTSWGKDQCEKFGAYEVWSGRCKCPEDRPIRTNECGSWFPFHLSDASPGCRCVTRTELTELKRIRCKKFGAKHDVKHGWCDCPEDRPRATKECGGAGNAIFDPYGATKGCRCVTSAELTENLKLPVSASALRFCDALVEHSLGLGAYFRRDMQRTLNKTSPEICQHALVGTITPTEAKRAPWAEEASALSRHRSVHDGDRDRGYGRMQPVKEDATAPEEKALWEHALAQVCKDECADLLHMMKKEAYHLAVDVAVKHVPFAKSCAEHVVQHVEAEVLGCCARSCGFNGATCLLWPFFSAEEKVNWDVECCGEMNILKNSSREQMCNSVLPGRLAKEASKYDLEEEDGADVGKVLIGQNTSLVWTKKGAQKFGTHAGAKVSIKFLLEHKNLGEEFLRRGFFREEPFSKIFDGGASSLLEVHLQDDTSCDFGKLQQQCPKKFHETYMKTCKESWKVTQVSEESEDSEENNFRHLAFHPEEGNCDESTSQSFATPEECESLTTNSFGEIIIHYFTYDTQNKEKPITCFTLSKQQCKGKDQWWRMIPLVSVQELVKEEDVNTYTELVYVRVKAD